MHGRGSVDIFVCLLSLHIDIFLGLVMFVYITLNNVTSCKSNPGGSGPQIRNIKAISSNRVTDETSELPNPSSSHSHPTQVQERKHHLLKAKLAIHRDRQSPKLNILPSQTPPQQYIKASAHPHHMNPTPVARTDITQAAGR